MAVSFDFRRRLGSGYFGEVWLAIDIGLGCEVALKCIPPDKLINKKNFYQEAQVLKASEHPNIVRVNETGKLDDGRIYVSMEYLPNGSLEDEAQGAFVALSRAKRVMIDVLRALAYAHEQGIVHCDIKPANILIGNANEGKLSDFGLALPGIRHLNLAYLKKYQYILHLAPEVRRVQDYSPLSDVYACGATYYRLVNGDNYLPQMSLNDAQILARRGEFPPRNKYRDFIPTSLKRMIKKALAVDTKMRYRTAEEMRHAVEQQIINVDWNENTLQDGIIWRGADNHGVKYEIKKVWQGQMYWMVETRRGRSQQHLRRIKRLCHYKLSSQNATSLARRILQNFVTGKHSY